MFSIILAMCVAADGSATPGVQLAMATPPPPMPEPRSLVEMPDGARAAYRTAVEDITQGDFHKATVALNALAGAHPHVPELYAARCSALMALHRAGEARTDCDYALRLSPGLWDARYGLALAEETLGRRDVALGLYRQCAAATGAGVRTEMIVASQARVQALTPVQAPPPVVVVPAPAPAPVVSMHASFGDSAPSEAPRARLPMSGQAPCHSSIDCGSGAWCRDRGDGLSVCMDEGRSGDYCHSGLDCASGYFCKEWGGAKVCMGN